MVKSERKQTVYGAEPESECDLSERVLIARLAAADWRLETHEKVVSIGSGTTGRPLLGKHSRYGQNET